MVHTALPRDFSSSLVIGPLGLSCGFSPTSAWSWPISFLLWRLLEHIRPSRWEGAAMLRVSWPPRSGGAIVELGCASWSGGRGLRQDGASGPPRWGGGKRGSDRDGGSMSLLLWEPSLVLREAGAKTWGERLQWGPTLCMSFSNGSLLLWQSALPQQAFLVMKLLAPSPQAVYSQPTVVLSLGLLSKPHVPSPSIHTHQWTHVSGWDVQGCGVICYLISVAQFFTVLIHNPFSCLAL